MARCFWELQLEAGELKNECLNSRQYFSSFNQLVSTFIQLRGWAGATNGCKDMFDGTTCRLDEGQKFGKTFKL